MEKLRRQFDSRESLVDYVRTLHLGLTPKK